MICFPSIIAYFLVLYEKKEHKHCDYGLPKICYPCYILCDIFIKVITQRKSTKGKGYYGFNV